TLHKYQFQVAEYLSYGYRPLEMRQTGQRLRGIIDHTVVSDFTGAFGVTEWMQIGFDLPYAVLDRFRPVASPLGTALRNERGLSDIRLELKARIIDDCRFPIGIAVAPFMTLPTGSDNKLLGDPGITGGLNAIIDGRILRRLLLTFNLGFQTGRKVNIQNVDYQHRLLAGAGIHYKFLNGMSVFGEVNSNTNVDTAFTEKDVNPVEGMVGMKWDVKKTGVELAAAAGNCLICGVKGANARAVLGVSYRYNSKKYQDLDAFDDQVCLKRFGEIEDAWDIYYLKSNCPAPENYNPHFHDAACPKYYELGEIVELYMRCPSRPEDYKEGVHDDACPKIYNLGEEYSQEQIMAIYTLAAAELGIRCPAPDEFNPKLHDDACPKYYDLQTLSTLSKVCPDDPAKYQPGIDDAACPKFYTLREQYPEDLWEIIDLLSSKDSDNDGINDFLDLCPNQAEDFNGFADQDGCPEGGIVGIVGAEIQTFKPVYFAFNSTKLPYDAQQALDQVIGVINETPWIRTIKISGHADARGTVSANDRIARARAKVVIDYMNQHGLRKNIDLVAVGYGSRKPVSLGTTETDYALNRRAVFTIASEDFAIQHEELGMDSAAAQPIPAVAEPKELTDVEKKKWQEYQGIIESSKDKPISE
ncbi:MAG: OmpA family protein, partial [Pseudomonadota bacterium]